MNEDEVRHYRKIMITEDVWWNYKGKDNDCYYTIDFKKQNKENAIQLFAFDVFDSSQLPFKTKMHFYIILQPLSLNSDRERHV